MPKATASKKVTYRLPCFGIVVEVDRATRAGTVTSELKKDGGPDTPHLDGALDAIESMVLAHACAGVDVCDFGYIEGVETAVDAILNRYS